MRRLSRRQQLSAAVLAVLALLFITLDFTGKSFAGARGGVTGALGSLYRGTDAVLGPARRFVQGVPDVGRNREQLARLQQQNRELQSKLAAAEADRVTAARLATLQLKADSEGWQIMPARVIATGPGAGFQWTVTLDVGAREHVLAGQTVTDGYALVGRVLSVQPSTSVVLLAADPGSGVGVRDTRTGALLLATGRGSAGISATPIDGRLDVRRGDTLVTGPTGKTTFVPGLPVGTVSSVTVATDGTLSAVLAPAAAMNQQDLVGIVLQPVRDTPRPALTPGTTP
ncbi:MAG TPA: rod shape-determining protein MreC [Jatrophihabitans sp.]|nr:rod shape-determining protein MreC [Jatrophihabitans sp.]